MDRRQNAIEALRTPDLTETQRALLRIAREPRMFGGEDGG